MGAFDNLLTGNDSSYVGKNLDPALLAQIQGLRKTGQWTGANAGGNVNATQQWYDGSIEGNNDYRSVLQPGTRWEGSGVDARQVADAAGDWNGISRVRPDTGGKILDYWNADGTYGGATEAQDGGGRNLNQGILMTAGAYAAGGGASGWGGGGAATGTGMTNGAFLGEGVSSGVGAWDAAAIKSAVASGELGIAASYAGQNLSNGTLADTISNLPGDGSQAATTTPTGTTPGTTTPPPTNTGGLTWSKFAAGMKDFGMSAGDIVKLGLAYGLSKNVDDPQLDPTLKKAIEDQTKIANDAADRAKTNDEYWQSTFAPRYLAAMDQQLADGRRLTDFNMGLAKKYDDRYWGTTAKQQDAFYDHVNSFDNDAARERLAGEAGTTSDMNNAAAMQALMRDLNRRGLNPNSGLVMSNMRQQGQQGALQKTMAMNVAREAARKEGLNMRAVAAGLGGNLTGASAGFSGQAGASSGLGMNGVNGANAGFNSANNSWNSTMGVGQNALNALTQTGMNMTNQGFQANQMNTQGWNQMLGYGLGMFGKGG